MRQQVLARYAGLRLPSWPAPRSEMAAPREEDYSRLSDPGRYQVGPARARVWAELLGDQPGVKIEALAPAPLDDDGRLGRFARGVRLTPPNPDALPLLLLDRDAAVPASEASLAVLHISVVEPPISVAMLPTCGCDACDGGSDHLLEAIDEIIGNVVGGPFVILRGRGWHAQWHQDGGSASGTGQDGLDFTELMQLCRELAAGRDVPLPEGTQAYVGRPWFN